MKSQKKFYNTNPNASRFIKTNPNTFIKQFQEMKKLFYLIALVVFTLTSCDSSMESKTIDYKNVMVSVNKMVYSTLNEIINSDLTDEQLINGDTLRQIIQNYDKNVTIEAHNLMKVKADDSINPIETLSNEQVIIINKLDSMALAKNFDFDEIKQEISTLPESQREAMYFIVAIVEGGATAIDMILNNQTDTPSYISGKQNISTNRLRSIVCNATTGGLGSLYGMWSGAIVGAYYGTMAGGFVGTVVGIASGAILSAYIC